MKSKGMNYIIEITTAPSFATVNLTTFYVKINLILFKDMDMQMV